MVGGEEEGVAGGEAWADTKGGRDEQALRMGGGEPWRGEASVADVGRSLGAASASSRRRAPARIWADGAAGLGGRRWWAHTRP